MLLGVARGPDAKVVVPPQHCDELVGMRETCRGREGFQPAGGSPRRAKLLDARSRHSSKSARSSARLAPMHVTCATTVNPLCCWISFARATVLSPRRTARPVRYRDEGGPQRRERLNRRQSWREPASSRGGKNSNEKNGRWVQRVVDTHGHRAYRKLLATPPQSSAQPSTMTKSSSLTGSETTGGLSIIIPNPMSIAATAKSIATNGR